MHSLLHRNIRNTALAIFVFASLGSTAVQAKLGTWKFQQGTRLVYRLKQTTDTRITDPLGNQIKSNEAITCDYSFTVQKVADNGNATVEISLTRIQYSKPSSNRAEKDVFFDSNDVEPENQSRRKEPTKVSSNSFRSTLRKTSNRKTRGSSTRSKVEEKVEPVEGVKDLFGKRATVVLGSNGKFVKYVQDPSISNLYAKSPLMGEVNAINADDGFVARVLETILVGFDVDESGNAKKSWDRSVQFETPAGNILAKTDFTYSGKTRAKINKFPTAVSMEIVRGTSRKGIELVSGKGEGVILFDDEKGRLVSRSQRIIASLIKVVRGQAIRYRQTYSFSIEFDEKLSDLQRR